MKKRFIYLGIVFLILNSYGALGQSFTVIIESTADYANTITPIKPGSSHQLLIVVKNNNTITYSVSIDKSAMGTVESWVSIVNNNQTISPGQTKTFDLTISVPLGTCDCGFSMPLYFNAKDASHNTTPFNYNSQSIIVDNSPPTAPTFSLSQESTSVFVYSWSSNDVQSSLYTVWNTSAGTNGIKEYKIDIKKPDGTIAATKTIPHNGASSHNFTQLTPNTNYKAVVTAVDLVGLTKSTEKYAKTTPAKPTNLNFTNITYIDAVLNWSASDGATGYNVYDSGNVKLNTTPITSTSFLIEDMDPATTYDYYAKAFNSGGESEKSDDASVTTLALPLITGDPEICSGVKTYTVSLLTGYMVSWTYNNARLNLVSASDSIANFSKILDGGTFIGASITAPNNRVLELADKYVWGGAPAMPTTIPSGYPTIQLSPGQILNISIDSMPGCFYADSVLWWSNGSIEPISSTSGTQCVFEATGTGNGNFYVQTRNDCGWSPIGGGAVYVSGGGGPGPPGPLMVYPNPATDSFEIRLDDTVVSADQEEVESELRIYDQYNNLKEIKKFKGKKHKIYTYRLTKGIYFIEVVNKNGRYITKIIIDKN